MLEFSKQILQKVSFDRILFRKELIKSLRRLGAEDYLTLKLWCLATFGHVYRDIIVDFAPLRVFYMYFCHFQPLCGLVFIVLSYI